MDAIMPYAQMIQKPSDEELKSMKEDLDDITLFYVAKEDMYNIDRVVEHQFDNTWFKYVIPGIGHEEFGDYMGEHFHGGCHPLAEPFKVGAQLGWWLHYTIDSWRYINLLMYRVDIYEKYVDEYIETEIWKKRHTSPPVVDLTADDVKYK